MLLDAFALAGLMHACLPATGPRTMAAIVAVESGADTDAIHDNTTGRAYLGGDDRTAIARARDLLARGHNVDLGLAQINSDNLPGLRLTVNSVFDPCTNLRGGGHILSEDYRTASVRFGAGQYALRRAIGAYNTGSMFAGFGYVSNVLAAAGISASDDFPVPDIAPMRSAAAHAPVVLAPKKLAVVHPRVLRASHATVFTPATAPIAIGHTAVFTPGFGGVRPAVAAAGSSPAASALMPNQGHF